MMQPHERRYYSVAEFFAAKHGNFEWFESVQFATRQALKEWKRDGRHRSQPRYFMIHQKDKRFRPYFEQFWQIRITNWDTRNS